MNFDDLFDDLLSVERTCFISKVNELYLTLYLMRSIRIQGLLPLQPRFHQFSLAS